MSAPVILFVVLSVLSAILAVLGVYVLAGFGWSLIATAVCFGAGAAFIRKGITTGG